MKKFFVVLSLVLALTVAGSCPWASATEGTTLPEETLPQETVPQETVPEETVPEETVPEETVPPSLEYDPLTEGILSSYYPVDRVSGYLLGVAPGTPAQKLCNVCVPSGTVLSSDTVGTGTTLTYTAAEGTGPSLTVVVTGDLNGDASVSITDMLMIKAFLLGEALEPAASAAGDVNFDGNVTITDFLRVKAALLGMGDVGAVQPVPAADPIRLLSPGTGDSWQFPEAASYRSGDPALVTVDGTGTITALTGEGSAFVYALDAGGGILARLLVTVLNDPISVSLEKEARLQMGQTLTLVPRFNHPVTPAVSWTSSEPAIATVDETGTVTGVTYGVTTVTATLSNGSAASCEITVSPPISAIEPEKKLYKLKPGTTAALSMIMTPADSGEELLWESTDPAVVTVDETGTVTAVNYGTATITVTGKYSGLTASCEVKVCDVKQVAITFDDGPSAHTAKLLDFLKEAGIKVTFFLVGDRLPNYKDTLIREVNEGHEIGYHSYDHTIQTTLSSERIIADYQKTGDMLREITGAEFTVWRTPGGGFNQRVLDCVPLPHIFWTVDTLDWKTRNAEKVYQAIVGKAFDGSIILLHDLHKTTVEGSIRAMQEMIEGDYEFLTVTELLSRNGTPPKPSTDYQRG